MKKTAQAVAEETPLEVSGTRLLLVDVDPHRARAFWSIEPARLEQARAHAGLDAPMVLRVYDITGSSPDAWAPNQVFDVEVQGLQGSWFVDMWRHERTFVADLGLLTREGGLISLARSNEISTPPAPEDDLPAEPAPEALEAPVVLADPVPDASPPPLSELPAEAAEAPPLSEPETEPAVVPEKVEAFPLVFWGEAAPGDSAAPEEVRVALDDQRASNRSIHEPPSPEALRPPSLERVVDAASPGCSDVETDMPADLQFQSGSEALAENSSASVPAPTPSPASSEPTPLPLQSQVHLSSSESGKKDVLLEVNAELHVYGRAKPNTELSLYGQKVRTRPDGTFSIRKPLPKGALVLPLTYTEE
ncbi:MAG: DUF4912 domain-containing protein [Verrucomicrobia bacterium]|nr:DUF4912 domain-containing protein [Kiritimatiellia bacterium]MCP5487613.1 DUF4912 domain-containing protein [Verrucomicrobiota bacterium]